MSDLTTYKHDEFQVVRTDNRFGGFEELILKDKSGADTHFVRKSLTLDNFTELNDLIALQQLVMKDAMVSTTIIHPMYTHNDRKWVLMSVPDEHCGTTRLAV